MTGRAPRRTVSRRHRGVDRQARDPRRHGPRNPDGAGRRLRPHDPTTNTWASLPPISSVAPADHHGSGRGQGWSAALVTLGRTMKTGPNTYSGHSGVDVYRLGASGSRADVTGAWPQGHMVDRLAFAGREILLAPDLVRRMQPPGPFHEHGYIVDPATLHRTAISHGPLDRSTTSARRSSGQVTPRSRSTPEATSPARTSRRFPATSRSGTPTRGNGCAGQDAETHRRHTCRPGRPQPLRARPEGRPPELLSYGSYDVVGRTERTDPAAANDGWATSR